MLGHRTYLRHRSDSKSLERREPDHRVDKSVGNIQCRTNPVDLLASLHCVLAEVTEKDIWHRENDPISVRGRQMGGRKEPHSNT